MKHYIGTDIIEITRIRKISARWGDKFLHRIYTEEEIRLYGGSIQSLAARFAGKEAVMKMLGAINKGISWQDIEILSDDTGKPFVNLSGKVKEEAIKLGIEETSISLSHSRENTVATIIGVSRQSI